MAEFNGLQNKSRIDYGVLTFACLLLASPSHPALMLDTNRGLKSLEYEIWPEETYRWAVFVPVSTLTPLFSSQSPLLVSSPFSMNSLFSRLSLIFTSCFWPSFPDNSTWILLICVALPLVSLIRACWLLTERGAEASDLKVVIRLIFRFRLTFDFQCFLTIDLRDFHHFKL